MKLWIQRISYKLFVSTMIVVALSFFAVTSCSHANKFSDLVNEDGIYYTGTQNAKITVKGSIWDNIVSTLSSVASFLVGIMSLALRGVAIGWIEIAELILTSLLYVDESLLTTTISAVEIGYTDKIVNIEKIVFNKVEMLDANIFKQIGEDSGSNIIEIVKTAVAKWYYILRLFAIAFMLLFLIFIGIKMAISTVASEKAIYKQMLIDWVAGMIIVFTIHYMMIFIFTINDSLVTALKPLMSEEIELQEEYQYGIESEENKRTYEDVEVTLYESARTRAYSLNAVDGFTGMVIYGVLVYYAWRFAIMYFIRLLNIMILTLVAPIIAISYAANKVISGKSKVFSNWLSEYIMNVSIQVFHGIIYVTFVSVALKLSMISLPGTIIAFAILNVMLKLNDLLRSLFKMSGGKGSLAGTMEHTGFKEMREDAKKLKTAVVGGQIGTVAMKATYRVASKPLRAGAEAALEKHMIKKAQKADKEEEERLEKVKEIQDTINNLKNDKLKLEQEKEELAENDKQVALERKEAKNEKNKRIRKQKLAELRKRQEENNAKKFEFEKTKQEQLEDIQEELETEEMLKGYEDVEKKARRETFEGKWANLWDSENYVERVRQKDSKWADGYARDEAGNFVYEKDKNGNYKYRKVKTRREGGPNAAFWRKKKDSIGQRFIQNAKLQKLVGIDEKEKKELQKQYKFWKSSILGLASAVVGFPALVINPALGIGLLGQASVSGLNYATKKRQVKNRPSYKNNKNYRVTDFSRGAQYTMQVETIRQIRQKQSEDAKDLAKRHPETVEHILRGDTYTATLNQKRNWIQRKFYSIHAVDNERLEVLEKENHAINRQKQSEDAKDLAKRHPETVEHILRGDTYTATLNQKRNWIQRKFYSIHAVDNERLEVLDELKYRRKLKTAISDFNTLESSRIKQEYKAQILEAEEEEKTLAEEMTLQELEFNDQLKEDYVIDVGDVLFGIDLDDETVQTQNRFMQTVEKIEEKDSVPREEKVKRIKRVLKDNKEELIQNQIMKYYARRGVGDISSTNMQEDDMIQIKKNVLGVLEEKGIIKKGEIKLKDDVISSEEVMNHYRKLNANKEETNEALEQRISADAILEYMQKNAIHNPNDLQSDVAKEGIYSIIKDKMMTDAERVVKQIKGIDPIKLSDVMMDAVDTNTKKVKRVKLTGKKDKTKLVERQANSEMNEVKNQLEEAICADTTEGITSERTLDMLFTLSSLGENNCEAIEKLGKKLKASEESQLRMLEFYQDGSRKLDRNRDGSRRLNPERDGSRRVNDLFVDTKQRKMQRRIFGPDNKDKSDSNNILDLINSVNR